MGKACLAASGFGCRMSHHPDLSARQSLCMLHGFYPDGPLLMVSPRSRNFPVWLVLVAVLLMAWWLSQGTPAGTSPASMPLSHPVEAGSADGQASGGRAHALGLPEFLPAEAHRTIALIQRGGPYPYHQDGTSFGNREGRLPRKPRGWYREFTVDTPGLSHRGARRIVTGGDPPEVWYYTLDHYESFRRFDVRGDRQ